MTSSAALADDSASLRACTICRDVQNFDLLVEDMENELGEAWGDLSFSDAAAFLTEPDADTLEFVAIAMDKEDEDDLSAITSLIDTAVSRSIAIILVAEDVSPAVLHQLLQAGATEFIPYPLPEGALRDAVRKIGTHQPAPQIAQEAPQAAPRLAPTGDRQGVIMPVHSLAGGVGGTTFAVNFAWELATISKKDAPRVCLLDFDLQSGAVSTYLDLTRREAVFELLSNTEAMDSESFMQALLPYNDTLHVLTAPAEMLPLDLVTPDDIARIISMAAANFDYVVIDMPGTVVQWTETVLSAAHVYFTLLELDMRSAQNALRMIRALKAEDLPVEKLRFMLNRAPKFTDLSGKSRVKRLAESLDISIEVQLPDGGRPVTDANDEGNPMAVSAKKNPLRKEIQKIALSAHELNKNAASAG